MKLFIATLLLYFASISLISAQNNEDAGMWNTISIEKKFKNKVSVFVKEEFRLKENFGRLNLFYTDVGIGYHPYNFLKVEIAYRTIEKYLIDDFFSIRHRLMLDITLKKKINNVTLSYRHRLQAEVRNVNSSEKGAVPEWYSRNKLTLKYDLHKKYSPYLSCELRYQISDPRSIESDQTWHRARYALGFDYELNKRSTFGIYYLIQREWNVSIPEDLYILGLEYTFTL
jgi:hypothetical protein